MSDLQCAATLLLVPAGAADRVAGPLARARIAQVWTGMLPPAQHAAEALAGVLGVGLTASRDLTDAGPSAAVLGEIADQHRGETVVVVVDEGEAITEVAIDGDGLVRRPWGAG